MTFQIHKINSFHDMHTRTIESLDTAVFLLLLVFADAKHKAIYFDIGLG